MINAIKKIRIKSKLSHINFFPTIVDSSHLDVFKNKITHGSKYTVVDVERNIERSHWEKGGWAARVDLFAKNIAESIEMISDKALSLSDRRKFLKLVEGARVDAHQNLIQ